MKPIAEEKTDSRTVSPGVGQDRHPSNFSLSSSGSAPGTLEENLLSFARRLRSSGLLLGPGDVAGGIEALASVDLTDREDFRLALRATFSHGRRELEIFDRCFEWTFRNGLLNPRRRLDADRSHTPGEGLPEPKEGFSLVSWDRSEEVVGESRLMSYSPAEAVYKKGFGRFDEKEMRRLKPVVRALARTLATRVSRRKSQSRRGELLDLRRSLRRNLGSGGELFRLLHKKRRREKTELLLILDVSGSMEFYSRFLLHFVYLLTSSPSPGRIEVFAFSTELYRLTGALRNRGIRDVLKQVQLSMPGRHGGTRIGSCLESLFERFGGYVTAKTTVVVLSDGWDTGNLDVLQRTMFRLKQRARNILWLNPLAGNPGYEPSTAGMKIVLPYVDVFAPAHNLESLRDLGRYLAARKR